MSLPNTQPATDHAMRPDLQAAIIVVVCKLTAELLRLCDSRKSGDGSSSWQAPLPCARGLISPHRLENDQPPSTRYRSQGSRIARPDSIPTRS